MPARTPLATAALDAALAAPDLAGWTHSGDAIAWTHTFADVPSAAAFIVRVLFAAEAADHHPEIKVEWGKVTVTWWTHSMGGLGAKDFAMAARTDAVLAPGAPRPA